MTAQPRTAAAAPDSGNARRQPAGRSSRIVTGCGRSAGGASSSFNARSARITAASRAAELLDATMLTATTAPVVDAHLRDESR